MKKLVLVLVKNKKILLLGSFLFLIALSFILFRSQKVSGKIKELGDYVYSSEVKIKTGSGDEDYDTISGYSGFDWGKIEGIMNVNKNRLLEEYAINISDPRFSWSDINPGNKPEGQVWKTSGDFNINNDISVGGKGTIIVEEGDLNINADISYEEGDPTSSIGFMVMNGSVRISKDIENLRGAYYAADEIIFE